MRKMSRISQFLVGSFSFIYIGIQLYTIMHRQCTTNICNIDESAAFTFLLNFKWISSEFGNVASSLASACALCENNYLSVFRRTDRVTSASVGRLGQAHSVCRASATRIIAYTPITLSYMHYSSPRAPFAIPPVVNHL